MSDAIARAVEYWKRGAVPLLPPLTRAEIQGVWRQLDRRLASDVVAMYSAVGGFENGDSDSHLWAMWSVEQILEMNPKHPSPGVLFGDFLLFSHGYSVRYETPERSSVWLEDFGGKGWQVADSLDEFLTRLLDDPRSLSVFSDE